jgi:ribosomal protein S18 acetylase RimI-like enzyme
MKLYFIGGASGSGKTAIMSELQKILGSEIKVYDFDDIGVPEGADKKWRQESTEKWLQKLLADGKDACLLGQIVLGETLACPSAKKLDGINFCLLDVSDFERIQRLKKRNTYGADQNMLNWSAWLRMHHQDPQWTQHVITDDSWDGLDFSALSALEDWASTANIEILDTTELDIKQVAANVSVWIKSEKLIDEDGLEYTIDLSGNSQAQQYVEQKMTEYHELQVGPYKREAFTITVKENGQIVAGLNGNVCGPLCNVWDLWVDEKFQRKKIGTRIMDQCETIAKDQECKMIQLTTSELHSKPFYEKIGYKVLATIPEEFMGHDTYIMRKLLLIGL